MRRSVNLEPLRQGSMSSRRDTLDIKLYGDVYQDEPATQYLPIGNRMPTLLAAIVPQRRAEPPTSSKEMGADTTPHQPDSKPDEGGKDPHAVPTTLPPVTPGHWTHGGDSSSSQPTGVAGPQAAASKSRGGGKRNRVVPAPTRV